MYGMKKKKKMNKGGKSFPDLNKDGKITQADILMGRGVGKKKMMVSWKIDCWNLWLMRGYVMVILVGHTHRM